VRSEKCHCFFVVRCGLVGWFSFIFLGLFFFVLKLESIKTIDEFANNIFLVVLLCIFVIVLHGVFLQF